MLMRSYFDRNGNPHILKLDSLEADLLGEK